MQEMQVRSLGWEDPSEEGMATHSSILAMDGGAWRAAVHGSQRIMTEATEHKSILDIYKKDSLIRTEAKVLTQGHGAL